MYEKLYKKIYTNINYNNYYENLIKFNILRDLANICKIQLVIFHEFKKILSAHKHLAYS